MLHSVEIHMMSITLQLEKQYLMLEIISYCRERKREKEMRETWEKLFSNFCKEMKKLHKKLTQQQPSVHHCFFNEF